MDPLERRKIQNRNAQRRFRNKSSARNQADSTGPAAESTRYPSIEAAANIGGPAIQPRVAERTISNPQQGLWSSLDHGHHTQGHQKEQGVEMLSDSYRWSNEARRNASLRSSADMTNKESQMLQRTPTAVSTSRVVPENMAAINLFDASNTLNDVDMTSLSQSRCVEPLESLFEPCTHTLALPLNSSSADHFDLAYNISPAQTEGFANKSQCSCRLGQGNQSNWSAVSATGGKSQINASNPWSSRTGPNAVQCNTNQDHTNKTRSMSQGSNLLSSPSSDGPATKHSGSKAAQETEDVDIFGVNKATEFVQSALHIAAERGHDTLVQMLLTAGFNVDERDSDDNTALHCAVYNCHPAVAVHLLQQGADPNAKNKSGWTPVHFAVLIGSADAVTLLVSHGGDLAIKAQGRQYCRSGKVFEPV